MLAFKRILNTEFPLRMLPLDYLETLQDDDGFELIVQTNTSSLAQDPREVKKSMKQSRAGRPPASLQAAPTSKAIYLLCFVNMVQIEAYLMSHGLLKGSDELSNQQDFS